MAVTRASFSHHTALLLIELLQVQVMNLRPLILSFCLPGAALILAAYIFHQRGDAQTRIPQPVLVELFTSEGCSSCPPADRLLSELDRRQDVPGASVIVLSEHVDYWNHLGWRDPYSLPQWSERQNTYARQFQLDSVYTPQAVVDGSRQVVGSDSGELRAAIGSSSRRKKLGIQIQSVSRSGDMLETQIAADAAQNAILYAVVADDKDRSSVAKGENAGRQLEHVAVARTMIALKMLHGASVSEKFQIAMGMGAQSLRTRLVVFIQEKNSGQVLAIASRGL
jgi:hypothetical protein